MVYEDMVVTSIAEKEKITVSDDEYTQYVENNLDTYGMSSVEEFESTYSKESVMDELLREKVQKFLLDNAKVTEVSEDEYYQEYDGWRRPPPTEDVVDRSRTTMDETEDRGCRHRSRYGSRADKLRLRKQLPRPVPRHKDSLTCEKHKKGSSCGLYLF